MVVSLKCGGKLYFFSSSGREDWSMEVFLWNFPTTSQFRQYLTGFSPFQCNYDLAQIIQWRFMQAHTEVVLDGLNVGLFSVSHGTMAKFLFRPVAVAASRLNRSIYFIFSRQFCPLSNFLPYLLYSIGLCLFLVSFRCWSNLQNSWTRQKCFSSSSFFFHIFQWRAWLLDFFKLIF